MIGQITIFHTHSFFKQNPNFWSCTDLPSPDQRRVQLLGCDLNPLPAADSGIEGISHRGHSSKRVRASCSTQNPPALGLPCNAPFRCFNPVAPAPSIPKTKGKKKSKGKFSRLFSSSPPFLLPPSTPDGTHPWLKGRVTVAGGRYTLPLHRGSTTASIAIIFSVPAYP